MFPITLSKAIKTHDGEVSALTLRAPTARSFIKHNEPFKLKWETNDKDERSLDITFNNAAMMGFLVDMIEPKVDDILLGAVAAGDWIRLRTLAADIILGVAGNEQNPT